MDLRSIEIKISEQIDAVVRHFPKDHNTQSIICPKEVFKAALKSVLEFIAYEAKNDGVWEERERILKGVKQIFDGTVDVDIIANKPEEIYSLIKNKQD